MLAKIIEEKKLEIANLPMIEQVEVQRYSLLKALQNANRELGLIAEVKKASPSKGVIKEDFLPLAIAKEYVEGKADALSVLTDEKFFQGHYSYLTEIKKTVNVPILRKDFIISSLQIDQSVRMGADAILLIATVLEKSQLQELYLESYERGLECLVEVHSQEDLEKVLSTIDPKIVGINNRNLKTFETSISQTIELAKEIRDDILVVSESGISQTEHLNVIKDHAKAILVGESFMRAKTPLIGIQELFGER